MKKLLTILLLCTLSAGASDLCKGTYKNGSPCKNKATIEGYCKLHSNKTPRCGATNKDGSKCMRAVKVEGKKCFIHQERSAK